VITDAIAGSQRVRGRARPDLAPDCIRVFDSGPNGIPEAGAGDDQLLGSGGTDSSGAFVDLEGLGIGLSRPLRSAELIYAVDGCFQGSLVGPTAAVTSPTGAPLLSPLMTLLLAGGLGMVGIWRLMRRARN